MQDGLRSSSGSTAYYARLVMPVGSGKAGPDALNHPAIVQEDAFYRVTRESKLYTVDFGVRNKRHINSDDNNNTNGDALGMNEHDDTVVLIQEMAKSSSARTSARDRQQMLQDRNAYCVKKMPEEVVATSGRFECLFGAQHTPTWFVQLKHVSNGYMILSMTEKKIDRKPIMGNSGGTATTVTAETFFLEKLPPEAEAVDDTGRFYYRVLVPIEVRRAPDLLAPVISRHIMKNAEEIIECNRRYRYPHSSVTFVKLAYEDGWLFETLNSGVKVLEKLATEPTIETGYFFYVVRIPVGIRVAPHIMAQRAGKGFKLHSIVEASQRFTPPGSKITYVRVCKEKNSRCGCSHAHSGRGSLSGGEPDTQQDDNTIVNNSSNNNLTMTAYTPCHGGWIFETTMDGQVVLEPIERPVLRQVERLFYRVLEDVDVLPTPAFTTLQSSTSNGNTPRAKGRNSAKLDAPPSPVPLRKRLKGTLIECSERLVPAAPPGTNFPEMAFVKLRHDVGWICERQSKTPYHSVLEQVQGFAVTRDLPKFYRALVPVYLRSAPDFDCPRLPGVPPMAVGTVFESCLQYTPPGSKITYVKVASESQPKSGNASGWLFDQTPGGDQVLEAVDDDPEKKNGKFFYRVVCERKEVLLSPEKDSEVVRYMFADTIFAAEMEYTLPRTKETYVRLSKEKGWVALDPSSQTVHSYGRAQDTDNENRTVVRISEELYNLYTTPPSWVSVGHPNRTWFKVPDELNRTVLAEETVLQMQIFDSRNVLATSSQGRDSVPLSRKGKLLLEDGQVVWNFTLEEIKHPASALLFTFPWKQVWWIFDVDNSEEKHCVELQHGLRGGFRSVIFDGEVLFQNRSVSDILWDSGSEFSFTWGNHTLKILITLEGAFFSQYLQFYSYCLLVDEEEIVPLEL